MPLSNEQQAFLTEASVAGIFTLRLNETTSAEERLDAEELLIAASQQIINKLTRVTLQGFAFTENLMPALLMLIQNNSELQQIDLDRNALGDENFVSVVNALQIGSSIIDAHFNSAELTSGCVEALSQFLTDQPHLKNLLLGGNAIDATGMYYLFDVNHASATLSKLEHLSLSGNPLGDEGIGALATWLLSQNSAQPFALKALYLKAVGLKQSGLNVLSNALPVCPHLTTLALESNHLQNLTVTGLIKCLTANTALQQLSMDVGVFDLPEMHALLGNPPFESPAIKKLIYQAKSYYENQAKAAYEKDNYLIAESYYRRILGLKNHRNDKSAMMKLEQVQLDLLHEKSQALLNREDPQKEKAQAEFINELKIRYELLNKDWSNYQKTAKNQDDYALTAEGKHLRLMTAGLQYLIQQHTHYKNYPELFPLWQAIEKKDIKQINELLRRGYNPNIADLEGNVAMHYAALTLDENVITKLITVNAHAHLRNRQKQCPWEMVRDLALNRWQTIAEAVTGNREKLVEMLRELQFSHARALERKPFYLFTKLADGKELTLAERNQLKEKFKSIEKELPSLKQIYERACETNPDLQLEFKKLLEEYSTIYDFLFDAAAKPACYRNPLEEMQHELSRLEKACTALLSKQDNASKQKLGFYNQIAKFLTDLIDIKKLSSEALLMGREYYQQHFANPAKMEADTSSATVINDNNIKPENLNANNITDAIPEGKQEIKPENPNANNITDAIPEGKQEIKSKQSNADFIDSLKKRRAAIDSSYDKQGLEIKEEEHSHLSSQASHTVRAISSATLIATQSPLYNTQGAVVEEANINQQENKDPSESELDLDANPDGSFSQTKQL